MKKPNRISQLLNTTYKLRIIPQSGHAWFVLGDVCKALQLNRDKALAVLPDQDKRTVEVESGKSCQIVSVSGYFALVWHFRAVMGIGLAEWLKNNALSNPTEQSGLTPATVEEFNSQFTGLMAKFEEEMNAKNL